MLGSKSLVTDFLY